MRTHGMTRTSTYRVWTSMLDRCLNPNSRNYPNYGARERGIGAIMGYELTGTVLRIGETKQVSERFRKRELVVETADNPKYPQPILMEITGDKTSQLDVVGVGDTVRVEFSIRGRAWNGNSGETKYFTSLDIWRVEVKSKATSAGAGLDGADNDSPQDDIPF